MEDLRQIQTNLDQPAEEADAIRRPRSAKTGSAWSHGQDAIDYHTMRAKTELDLGLTATITVASRARLKLAALHMQRLRELTGRSGSPKPLLTM